MPRISVILTSFNHEKYICEAIDSVINQTFTCFELIILDDASSDSTWELIKQYSEPRIKAFRSDRPGEITQHLNDVIAGLAAGEYIAIHHSDDVWELDKLEKQAAFLDANPEVGAVFTWVQIIDENGAKLTNDWFNQENKTRWQWLNELFFERNHLSHPSVLIRKQCYQEVGVYRLSLYQTPDAEMWSRVLIKFPIHLIQEKLTKHRRFTDKSNVSGNRIESAIRANNEWNVLRANYLSVTNFDDIVGIFPSLERFRNPQGFDNKFLLAMACLYECNQRSARQLGLTWLFELINDENRSRINKKLYSFSHVDLFKLTGGFDVYFAEGNKLIAEWLNFSQCEWDKERKRLIEGIDWVTTERDWLNTEMDRLNTELNIVIHSSTWKLTRPLRFVAKFMRKQLQFLLTPTPTPTPTPVAKADIKTDVTIAVQAESSYLGNVFQLPVDRKILLVLHEFSRTSAPYAVLYLARALYSLYGVRPVIICPQDGLIREEFEQENFFTIVAPSLFSYDNNSSEISDFIAGFERVIVTSLASFDFIRCFKEVAKQLIWWLHETGMGFTTVAKMTTDLPQLFAACEAVWLGSPLCFPFALQYTSLDKLHLLLYGCADTALPHHPHKLGKVVFSIVGSVEPRKGQDIFISAIEKLPEKLRNRAVFRIIGSPLSNDEFAVFYLKVRSKAALIPEVTCIKNMPSEELLQFYAETDVLVSASRDDPLPIAITQGLMFSKVCLCSSIIGHAKLLEDGRNALIFTNESAEELSEKMAWLLQNPTELTVLGKAGREIYEKYFIMSIFVNSVGDLMR